MSVNLFCVELISELSNILLFISDLEFEAFSELILVDSISEDIIFEVEPDTSLLFSKVSDIILELCSIVFISVYDASISNIVFSNWCNSSELVVVIILELIFVDLISDDNSFEIESDISLFSFVLIISEEIWDSDIISELSYDLVVSNIVLSGLNDSIESVLVPFNLPSIELISELSNIESLAISELIFVDSFSENIIFEVEPDSSLFPFVLIISDEISCELGIISLLFMIDSDKYSELSWILFEEDSDSFVFIKLSDI